MKEGIQKNSIKYGDFLEKPLNWISEHGINHSMLFFAIGGMWQFLELFLISPAYVRFFSVTQALKDGILIFGVWFFTYKIFVFFLNLYNERTLMENSVHVLVPIFSMTVMFLFYSDLRILDLWENPNLSSVLFFLITLFLVVYYV